MSNQTGGGIGEDPQQSLRYQLAEPPVAEAIRRGFVFGLFTNSRNNKPGLVLSRRESNTIEYFIPAALMQYEGLKMFSTMLRNVQDDRSLKSLVRALCLEYKGHCNGVFQLHFSGTGHAKLTNGITVGIAEAPNGGYLKAESPAIDAEVLLNWMNQDG